MKTSLQNGLRFQGLGSFLSLVKQLSQVKNPLGSGFPSSLSGLLKLQSISSMEY